MIKYHSLISRAIFFIVLISLGVHVALVEGVIRTALLVMNGSELSVVLTCKVVH